MRDVNIAICLIFSHSLDGFKTPKFIRQIEWFKDEREGCVPATHSLDRGLKIQKTFLLNSKETRIEHKTTDMVEFMNKQSL